jgi:hypothetical protein
LFQIKSLETLAKLFERDWIRIHGPPNEVSGDQEFVKSYFQRMLTRHAVVFKERPARRHNKSRIVERGNAIVKMFVNRLILDVEAQGSGPDTSSFAIAEILSEATYLKKYLIGQRGFVFEQARGYQPSIVGKIVAFTARL